MDAMDLIQILESHVPRYLGCIIFHYALNRKMDITPHIDRDILSYWEKNGKKEHITISTHKFVYLDGYPHSFQGEPAIILEGRSHISTGWYFWGKLLRKTVERIPVIS